MPQLFNRSFQPYISQAEINSAVQRIATAIDHDYQGKNPLLIGVLNGAFIFAADLCKAINLEVEITFVQLKSYDGTSSSGLVQSLIGLKEDIKGRDVIIIEDIVDTGNTLNHFIPTLTDQGAHSVKIASLLFKPEALQHKLSVNYVGFEIPNAFVVGYGLDYNGLGRNWNGIYQLADKDV